MKIGLQPGERGLVVGQTGSGKTALAAWLAQRHSRSPVIIYDTKIDPIFTHLGGEHEIVGDVAASIKAMRARHGPDYIIYRPPTAEVHDPELLDENLRQIVAAEKPCLILIDEAYMLHNGSKAGPGITSLLTRGRSKGIGALVCTQRPAWLSRFCITEAQRFYVAKIADKADAQRLGAVIPGFENRQIPPYHFWYYDYSLEKPQLISPCPLLHDSGYTILDDTSNRWI